MDKFLIDYGVCIILGGIGLFFVIMSYIAAKAGRSGVPIVGGILIIIGFLTTPVKWLALLGMVDYGLWALPYIIIIESIKRKKFSRIYSQQGYIPGKPDNTKMLKIYIPDRDETLEWGYGTNIVYILNIPKIFMSICVDKEGRRFMLADILNGSGIEVFDFENDKITLYGYGSKKKKMEVVIEVVANKYQTAHMKR